jgi:hypothetical protein
MGREVPGRQVRRARAARGYAETRAAAMTAFARVGDGNDLNDVRSWGGKADIGRNRCLLWSAAFDPGCVKTHTSEKCRKNNSPTMHPTSRVQYDLTLRNPIARRCFYVRGKRWSFHTAKTHSGPQSSQNPALQRVPDALQNGTSLLGRPPGMPGHQPRRSCGFQGATHTATKIFRPYPQSGLTAPNGGIRSASSIGTIVRSSAVVVGQRSERGVP